MLLLLQAGKPWMQQYTATKDWLASQGCQIVEGFTYCFQAFFSQQDSPRKQDKITTPPLNIWLLNFTIPFQVDLTGESSQGRGSTAMVAGREEAQPSSPTNREATDNLGTKGVHLPETRQGCRAQGHPKEPKGSAEHWGWETGSQEPGWRRPRKTRPCAFQHSLRGLGLRAVLGKGARCSEFLKEINKKAELWRIFSFLFKGRK